MGRIILTDDAGYVPSTFADDSYADSIKTSTVTVLAQFPEHVDFTWHFSLLSKLRKREAKYADFRRNRESLPPELVRSVLQGVRKAIIAISDDRQHRIEMTATLENISGRSLKGLAPEVRKYFEGVVSKYADEMVLLHSPLSQVEHYLGADDDSVNFDRYLKTLENPRNVRIFACRAAGAFFEVIDPDSRKKAIDRLYEYRYSSMNQLQSQLLYHAGIPTRVFDKGNQKVTNLIRKLRQDVHDRIESTEYLLLPDSSGIVEEADSKESKEVGASDIAAGYARELYESSEGTKKVTDAFDLVILNGQVLKG